MLKTKVKNTYTDILDIKSALMQSRLIINKLEKENISLKRTLSKVIPSTKVFEREFMRYEHIHKIKEN